MLRALRVMKTLAASLGITVASTRALAIPTARAEYGFIRGLALQRELASFAGFGHAVNGLVEDHKGDAALLELAGDHSADAAITADDGVVFQFFDFVFYTFTSECALNLGLREPLDLGARDENDARAAEYNQGYGPYSQAWVGDGMDLAKAHAECGDDDHVKRIAPRPTRRAIPTCEDDHDDAHESGSIGEIRPRAAQGVGHIFVMVIGKPDLCQCRTSLPVVHGLFS